MDETWFNPYGWECSLRQLWHTMDWLGRLDFVALALLFAYAASNTVQISRACHTAHRSTDTISKELRAELNKNLRDLCSIAFVSPYLGLAGTCFGIMNAFIGIGMEKQAALALTASRVVAAFATTAVGIIVALAAECFSHYLRSFSELLVKVSLSRSKFHLKRRFSEFPSFALIAAPALGLSIAAFMLFSSLQGAMGFEVALASNPCISRGNERAVILHVTDQGKIFINGRPEESNRLADRLSEIYESRSHHTLYLSADNAAPFQTVADAIDLATNAVDMRRAKPLHITLGLLTPGVQASPCPQVH